MQTVHFTELKEFATRGQIERGVRYLHCHDLRTSPGSGRAFCYEELTLSHVQLLPRAFGEPIPKFPEDVFWTRLMPQYFVLSSRFGGRTRHYASDSGLWDVEDIGYINQWNYLLNINQLLQHNILIDQTPIPVL